MVHTGRITVPAVVAFLIGCAPAMVVNTANEEATVRARSADYLRAAQARDVDRIMALTSPSATMAMPNAPLASGGAAVRAAWADFLGMPNVSISWQPTSFMVASSGDIATESGTYTLGFNSPDGRVTDSGNYTAVWHKVGGDWVVVNDIATSSQPMPAAPPVSVVVMFDTSTGMTMHSAAGTAWNDFDVPGFPPGLRLAVVHGDPAGEGDYTVRLMLPAGYEFPLHWHPKAEHLTVLSGTFRLAQGRTVDRSALKTYAPGDFLYLPARQSHWGNVVGQTVVQLHGIGPFVINLGPSPQ